MILDGHRPGILSRIHCSHIERNLICGIMVRQVSEKLRHRVAGTGALTGATDPAAPAGEIEARDLPLPHRRSSEASAGLDVILVSVPP